MVIRKYTLGVIALVVSVVALGLAAIPPVVVGDPLPELSDRHSAGPRDLAERKSDVTVKIKKVSITFGKAHDADDGTDTAFDPAELHGRGGDPGTRPVMRALRVTSIVCALVALVLAPCAWLRDRDHVFSWSATAVASVAMTWQYVVLGLAVGAGFAMFLIVLMIFASLVGDAL